MELGGIVMDQEPPTLVGLLFVGRREDWAGRRSRRGYSVRAGGGTYAGIAERRRCLASEGLARVGDPRVDRLELLLVAALDAVELLVQRSQAQLVLVLRMSD